MNTLRHTPYAIFSHTWTEGQEVTYNEVVAGQGKNKAWYDKLRICAEKAATDGYQYFWIDTCCTEKADPVELSTALKRNSVRKSIHCIGPRSLNQGRHRGYSP
jgi:hypothetical protein